MPEVNLYTKERINLLFYQKKQIYPQILKYFYNYFDRIAITGSRRAAIHAGIIPDKTPMMVEIDKPMITF